MKKTTALLLGIVLTSVGHLLAQNNFEPLFNGKDLKGWVQYNGQAKYTVEQGELVGRTVPGQPNSFLSTEKKYGDFIYWN